MPWSCPECETEVGDALSVCPECSTEKSAWSLVVDKTREFVVARKAVRLLRGDGSDADDVRAFSKATVRALHEAGERPAPGDVLVVRLTHGGAKDLAVAFEVVYEGQPSEERAYPRERPEGAPAAVDSSFLFVYGDGDLEGVSFEGIEVIDISEEGGHAPDLEVAALGRNAAPLPVVSGPQLAIVGRDGGPPRADLGICGEMAFVARVTPEAEGELTWAAEGLTLEPNGAEVIVEATEPTGAGETIVLTCTLVTSGGAELVARHAVHWRPRFRFRHGDVVTERTLQRVSRT